MLILKNISKHYIRLENKEKTLIFEDVNLKVQNKEIVAIIGPSGVGKSTLLHITGLMDTPDSGEIIIDGRLVTQNHLRNIRAKSIGFVHQYHYLLKDFTALENVMMPMLILGCSKKIAKEKGQKLLIHVGLESKVNCYPNVLSGGEQQRVSIARALANQPKIILADEPTGNLDENNATKVFDLLTSAIKRGERHCAVIVTHSKDIYEKCDVVYKLNNAKLERV